MTRGDKLALKLLEGEYWFGGVVRHGLQMPFGPDSQYHWELMGNLDGNQGSPLLLSTKGRYVWSEAPYTLDFDRGTLTITDARDEVITAEGLGNLRGAYRAACERFFPPSGRCPDELAFTAPQYNAWIELKWDPTQEKVLRYAQEILDHGFPPGVLMIDDNWFEQNGVWRFHPGRFPDPGAMTEALHRMGFKVVVWICPFICPDAYVYRLARERKYLITTPKGEPVIRRWWNGYSALLDLTNPGALAWFKGQMDELVDRYGVDGFKFDGGDPYTYRPDDVTHLPSTPNSLCEAFAAVGLNYPLSEYRACWKLGGEHLIQRVRDKGHRWGQGGMADLLPTGLVQGLVGYPFTCPDMVGGGLLGDFLDPATKIDQELFVRYAQCSTMFPIMQFSTMPWRVLDKEHYACCLKMLELKKQIAPEMLELARQAGRTGEPILRHMAYNFPDEGLETVMDQFMVGEDILVAPVLQKGARKRTIRFPTGKWLGDDGSVVEGPCRLDVPSPLERLLPRNNER